jgi:formylglycine-generating enzyme required for sulfatase activity
MRKVAHSLVLITALLTSVAHGQIRMESNETPIEATTSYVRMPREIPAALFIATCAEGCPSVQVYLRDTSQFLLGKQTVTYPQFRAAAAETAQNLTVFYDTKTNVVTRMIISR